MKKTLFLLALIPALAQAQIKVFSTNQTVIGDLTLTAAGSTKLGVVGDAVFVSGSSGSAITSAPFIRGANNYVTGTSGINPSYSFYGSGNDQTGIYQPAQGEYAVAVKGLEAFRMNGANAVFTQSTTSTWQAGVRSILSNSLSTSFNVYYSGSDNFYVAAAGWVYYNGGSYLGSDRKIKRDIATIERPLDKLLKLRGVTYKMNEKYSLAEDKDRVYMGLIAQEVEVVIPEVVRNTKDDIKAVSYANLVALCIEAIKEQNTSIEQLKQEVENLKNTNNELTSLANNSTSVTTNKLFQNIPNPFNAKTTIKFSVDRKASAAEIVIYNLKGDAVKKYDLKNGSAVNNTIEINANELEPGAYLYSLVVENTVVETRTMILTK